MYNFYADAQFCAEKQLFEEAKMCTFVYLVVTSGFGWT